METQKRTPERRCVGCGGHFPKPTLIRVVREPDGTVSLDLTGRKNGRGAYLCRNAQCLKRARKNGRLKQGLSCEITEDVFISLEAGLDGNG